MKKNYRSFIFLFVALVVLAVLLVLSTPVQRTENVSLSRVIDQATSGQVEKIEVAGDKLTVTLKDPNAPKQIAFKERSANLADYGIDYKKVQVVPENPDNNAGRIFDLIGILLPVLLIIGFFYFMMRQAQGSSNQAMSFGKSRARLFGSDKQKVTFSDVAGSEEAKQELTEIVEFLKYPQKFEALGAKIPKGVLLFGPPGTGKTLLARAVAGEAGTPFFSISGSEFVEMFVGVGASRVRDLFMKAKKNSPCIIFIDEIDAVGRQRGTGMGGGHDEREQTLNQILVEMDGFEQGTTVIVMAATNRPDVLDPALLRPGRFDRRVTLDAPDLKNRQEILKVHAKEKPLATDTDLNQIAKKTPGFSGADLANLVNEAAILAARLGQKKITQKDLNASVEKVLMGPERRSHIMSEKEKEITAYHEAGHAIVSHILPNCHPVHKVTIVSRGGAGGFTWSLPDEDKLLNSTADFKDDLAMMLGGRVAEAVVFSEITTGASNDLQKATQLARRMVGDYGMSQHPKLRNRVLGSQSDAIFLGRDLNELKNYSEDVARIVDDEVALLIDEAAVRAEEVIREHRDKLDKIAAKLMKDETIDGPEFEELVGKRPKVARTSEVDTLETPAGKAAEEGSGGLSGKPATA
jgi:cell division protease FtsH